MGPATVHGSETSALDSWHQRNPQTRIRTSGGTSLRPRSPRPWTINGMSDNSFPPEGPGTFLELRRLVVSAINTRIALLVSLSELASRSSSTADRRFLAAEDPTHVDAVNAAAIIQMFGFIEGFVEGSGSRLGPAIHAARDQQRVEFRRKSREMNREARARGVSEEAVQLLSELGTRVFEALRPGPPLMRLNRTLPRPQRWEDGLTRVGLGGPSDRPIPDDMAATLNELAQVRNVLLHRMGRIDQAALDAVAEGPWATLNELVRIDGDLYKRYIAALWSYAEEIQDRFLMALGQEPRNGSLADWRSRVPAGG